MIIMDYMMTYKIKDDIGSINIIVVYKVSCGSFIKDNK